MSSIPASWYYLFFQLLSIALCTTLLALILQRLGKSEYFSYATGILSAIFIFLAAPRLLGVYARSEQITLDMAIGFIAFLTVGLFGLMYVVASNALPYLKAKWGKHR
ncbi:hypothetical protein ONV78_28220 [Hahella sp. CR1]|uniref:hypothetical protein n=1 Tax=Hahella sp. CR1 TaxID=2992807 RepID=UPI002443041A|nr:hypothetical protein [Hahella sp. CR1]MDG9671655.1 hypothetical protein [Hahella sp. CR1]